jgi:hypothetical protein
VFNDAFESGHRRRSAERFQNPEQIVAQLVAVNPDFT